MDLDKITVCTEDLELVRVFEDEPSSAGRGPSPVLFPASVDVVELERSSVGKVTVFTDSPAKR